jgi:hypothetical protein
MKKTLILTLAVSMVALMPVTSVHAEDGNAMANKAASLFSQAASASPAQAKDLICKKGSFFKKAISLCRSGEGIVVKATYSLNKDLGGAVYAACSLFCQGHDGYDSSHTVEYAKSKGLPAATDKTALSNLFVNSSKNAAKSPLVKTVVSKACMLLSKQAMLGAMCQKAEAALNGSEAAKA